MPIIRGVNKVVIVLTNLANFSSNFGTIQNCFTNQNSDLNNEGYDSKGNLPHFADKPNDDMEMYFEQAIEGGMSVGEAVEAPTAPNELDVMHLLVTQLHYELKKRGCGTQGKKAKLQDCLKEAILLNVPVALGEDVAWCHESMVGLDMMAKWEVLTRCTNLIPEPKNTNANLCPPHGDEWSHQSQVWFCGDILAPPLHRDDT